ncbi:MAG: NAD(P)-dependent oxidoreductase [Acidimicrobiales bacterium]|jgi:3-hydroxyisobutyrate dehydrogenase
MEKVEEVSPATTRVGWIGTGVMGSTMCAHLLNAGYPMTVSSRTRSKADALVAAGATWADTPGEVAKDSDVIFTMLGFPVDVREVVFGANGLLDSAHEGSVVVDMSTSEPALAVEIAERATARGVHSLDAPVSGGDVGAKNATLSIMVGGPEDVFLAIEPCLKVMGATIVRQGDHGAGQHTKMMNQVLIASNMMGVCEALLYAYRAGLDLETVLASVSGGAAGSWSLSNLAPRAIAGNMAPGFYVDHFVKDMGIALREAGRMHLSLPGLALAHQLYVALQAQGGGLDGTQSLIRALGSLSGINWDQR